MDAVWINFFYHPLIPLGILLSFLSVLVFLLFLRGFLSGVMYLFTLNGNDDFLRAARVRVLWSFFLLAFLFSVWELLRWLGALLTGGPTPRGFGVALVLLSLLGAAVWAAKFFKKHVPR